MRFGTLRAGRLGEGATGFVLIVLGVFLGWEVLKVPVTDRGPPSVALRLSPGSPEALRRAAEAELLAQRHQNALALAEDSLVRAPFNARALRVRGLAEDQVGSADRADQLLTLAGNWSLRDDPSHGWLVQRRLRQGDYASAFAHADTLARRRDELLPQAMNLFSTAGAVDQRAATALVRLLASDPPWRSAYLVHLQGRRDGDQLLAGLAVGLQSTGRPLTNSELRWVYASWEEEGRYGAIAAVRQSINRPPADSRVVNGDFAVSADEQVTPFGWSLGLGAGVATEITEDDSGNSALRVEYDGYGATVIARQLLTLPPGEWRLAGKWSSETPGDPRMRWTVTCVTGSSLIASPVSAALVNPSWSTFSASFRVPVQNCPAQSLSLSPAPGDRRTTIVVWFDDLVIQSAD